MNLSQHAKWALKIIEISKNDSSCNVVQQKIKEVFGVVIENQDEIKEFSSTMRRINLICKILKTRGLNERTFLLSERLLSKLSAGDVIREKLESWLDSHRFILQDFERKGWINSIPVSSDSIESFFFQDETSSSEWN